MKTSIRLLAFVLLFPLFGICQNSERVVFDPADSVAGYYLAVPPQSGKIKGVLVLLCPIRPPESMLSETKLHNVAFSNDILTILATVRQKLYADSGTVRRINAILSHVVTKYAADTSKFAVAGFNFAGMIALRYTELTYEHPVQFLVHPKAVFGIDSPVDLFGVYHWCERQIKKNYYPGVTGDAHGILGIMTKENGSIYDKPDNYKALTAFYRDGDATGNEKYLQNVAVRLYYDTDIQWQLKNRRNGFYDTNIPDGSELINRLLLSGNQDAEFMPAKEPGVRSNGVRNPDAFSIVDEVDCIQWIKRKLNIFDPINYMPSYKFVTLAGWGVEHSSFPLDFAPGIPYKGVEDLRFNPEWANNNASGYWSYTYLWWLEGEQKVDAEVLMKDLKMHYEGLLARNIPKRNIPAKAVTPVNVTIKKVKTEAGDQETYSGTISMLDYMTEQPMVLNCTAHVNSCKGQGHTAIIFELSPMPFENAIWYQLDNVRRSFECGN